MNLKEVRLIRVLLWILIYLLVLFLLVFTVVIPSIKEYREAKSAYVKASAKLTAIESEFEDILVELKSLQKREAKVLDAFKKSWNKDEFIKSAQKFFSKVELKDIEQNISDPYYKIYELNVVTQMESPTSFYSFLDSLSNTDFIVQVDFPIAFRASSGVIDGVFKIRIFEEKRSKKETQSLESNLTSTPME